MTWRLSQCLNIAWKDFFYLSFLQHHKTTQKSPKILKKIRQTVILLEKYFDHFKTDSSEEYFVTHLREAIKITKSTFNYIKQVVQVSLKSIFEGFPFQQTH